MYKYCIHVRCSLQTRHIATELNKNSVLHAEFKCRFLNCLNSTFFSPHSKIIYCIIHSCLSIKLLNRNGNFQIIEWEILKTLNNLK